MTSLSPTDAETSATVLLLLSNDEAVLSPWVNSRKLNLFTDAVVAVLVMLSIILTASVLLPDRGEQWILSVLAGGSALALAVTVGVKAFESLSGSKTVGSVQEAKSCDTDRWRMPPLDRLSPARLSTLRRIGMIVLRGYLVGASGLVLVRILQLATAGA